MDAHKIRDLEHRRDNIIRYPVAAVRLRRRESLEGWSKSELVEVILDRMMDSEIEEYRRSMIEDVESEIEAERNSGPQGLVRAGRHPTSRY